MAGSGGNYGGLFCVFLLLLLVSLLAVASLVLQIFSWTMAMDDGEEGHDRDYIRGPRPSESDTVRGIRENLAMLQPDNGGGPPIQKLLENREYDYKGDDRVWIFGMGWSSTTKLVYYDTTTGDFGGYHVDMVNAVCQAAGKNCRMVAQHRSCWETDPDYGARGGPALHSRWFDACVGLSPSFTRKLVFDFTDSLSPPPDVNFYTLPGNPGNFNWRDLRGKKIGFLAQWYSDVDCVARNGDKIQGAVLSPDQFIYYDSEGALLAAIQSRQVDAGFFTAESEDIAAVLEVVSDRITNCALDGDAVMVRKDSKVREWWNPALQTVLNSYEYREICKDLDSYYSHLPGRSAEYICRS